jgi:hypothetical protein
VCHILSNAPETSRYATELYCLIPNSLYDPMCLFYCGVPLPEAELMMGVNLLFPTIARSLFNKKFSETLDTVGNKAIGIRHADHVAPSIHKNWH